MIFLLKDYETRSRVDLAACGQHIYSKDESTEILCIGYKIIGEAENKLVSYPAIYTDDPSETKEYYYALKHADFIVAHNAPFEQAIYNNVQAKTTPMSEHLKYIPPEKFICTMAGAGLMGLPRKLEKVAEALNLPHKKDTEGRRLMLSMCKPKRNINRKTDIDKWVEWVLGDENLKRLYEYCKTDLVVEESLFNFISEHKAWTSKERYTWVLDQYINQRGFKVDLPFVEAARELLLSNEKILNKELLEKTMYTVKTAKSTKSLKNFIETQGHAIANVQKKTVSKLLHDLKTEGHERDKDLIQVLTIREELGLSSTSKYESFYNRTSRQDFRVRDNLIYCGANTGRWSGTGVQPQNFPRGTVKVKPYMFDDIKHTAEVNGLVSHIEQTDTDIKLLGYFETDDEDPEVEAALDVPITHAEYAKIFHPKLTGTLSSMLRGCIVADTDKFLFVGDFSSIEARVLLWCAGDAEGLAEYEGGLDAYTSMAATIFDRPYAELLRDYEANGYSEERQLGKKVILACGYQMGLKKFSSTLQDDGIFLEESMIQAAHTAFKVKYPKVPELWRQTEKAAIEAVLNPTKSYIAGRCQYAVHKDFLTCRLPSGRRLWYYKPEVRQEPTPWGDLRHKLYYNSVNPMTRQYSLNASYGGKLVENNVQAISRDCMSNSMIALDNASYTIVLTVHDEVLSERDAGGTLEEFKSIMSKRPEWGLHIPLKVGAWRDVRYKK